ncbi:TetR/AcrR family transcriptional regulator [Kitasatospora sp. NPDC052868]|uniref:TetR/AcrR family transcriptional regulator n=1 Tax=Kitasatospora sp. NPDC052868 TaxID=3364060 RepID=UPI0037CA32CB
MSTPHPQLRADAARNRLRTLEATRALLADPRAVVTVEAIARQAEVSAATVVRTFGGKEALIDAAASDLLEPLVRRARELLGGLPPEEALRTFLGEMLVFQAAHHTMNAQIEALNLPATQAQEAALEQALLDLVVRAREAGVIRADLDPAVATILIGECTYAIARSRAHGPGLSADYLTVLMDGLRPQPPADR